VESMKIDSCYGVAVRGLWRTEGDFMGGPFVTYAFLDERKQEVVFIDSYTYAPKFDKREYVKSMEAMIFAIRLNDK
jgi:dTDP-D-glucose 4,6-dehydratase